MKIKYSKFEHQVNDSLKEYLADDSYDQLMERLGVTETSTDIVSEKINEFYKEQLKIDKHDSRDRVRIDRIITFSEKILEPEKFCNLLLQIANICLQEGKLDLANEIFRKANKQSVNNLTKAESILGIADIMSRKAKFSTSIDHTNEAKALFKSVSDFRGLAKCENLLGIVQGELGDILKAKKHFLTSLSLIKSDEELELAANLYTNLGIVYHIQESHKDSVVHLNKALSFYKTLGRQKNVCEVSLNLGLVLFETKEYEAAINILNETIETAKSHQLLPILTLAYLAKAQVLIQLNDFHYASEFADAAFTLSHDLDDKLSLADAYKVKGIIERYLENYKASETYLLNSLRINRSLYNELNIAETSFELGLLYEKMNDFQAKTSNLNKSKEYFNTIGATSKVAIIEELLGFSTAV